MSKKEVNICDRCDKRIASDKCFICQKDMCSYCTNYMSLSINKNNEYSVSKDELRIVIAKGKTKHSIPICEQCKDDWYNIYESLNSNMKGHRLLVKLLDVLQDETILEAL